MASAVRGTLVNRVVQTLLVLGCLLPALVEGGACSSGEVVVKEGEGRGLMQLARHVGEINAKLKELPWNGAACRASGGDVCSKLPALLAEIEEAGPSHNAWLGKYGKSRWMPRAFGKHTGSFRPDVSVGDVKVPLLLKDGDEEAIKALEGMAPAMSVLVGKAQLRRKEMEAWLVEAKYFEIETDEKGRMKEAGQELLEKLKADRKNKKKGGQKLTGLLARAAELLLPQADVAQAIEQDNVLFAAVHRTYQVLGMVLDWKMGHINVDADRTRHAVLITASLVEDETGRADYLDVAHANHLLRLHGVAEKDITYVAPEVIVDNKNARAGMMWVRGGLEVPEVPTTVYKEYNQVFELLAVPKAKEGDSVVVMWSGHGTHKGELVLFKTGGTERSPRAAVISAHDVIAALADVCKRVGPTGRVVMYIKACYGGNGFEEYLADENAQIEAGRPRWPTNLFVVAGTAHHSEFSSRKFSHSRITKFTHWWNFQRSWLDDYFKSNVFLDSLADQYCRLFVRRKVQGEGAYHFNPQIYFANDPDADKMSLEEHAAGGDECAPLIAAFNKKPFNLDAGSKLWKERGLDKQTFLRPMPLNLPSTIYHTKLNQFMAGEDYAFASSVDDQKANYDTCVEVTVRLFAISSADYSQRASLEARLCDDAYVDEDARTRCQWVRSDLKISGSRRSEKAVGAIVDTPDFGEGARRARAIMGELGEEGSRGWAQLQCQLHRYRVGGWRRHLSREVEASVPSLPGTPFI